MKRSTLLVFSSHIGNFYVLILCAAWHTLPVQVATRLRSWNGITWMALRSWNAMKEYVHGTSFGLPEVEPLVWKMNDVSSLLVTSGSGGIFPGISLTSLVFTTR